ncbi:P-loop containing nucleoside triphosphate hydrolase protein [Phyllosticta citricarpa]
MLRASASALCPRCEVRGLCSSTRPTVTGALLQQSRFASKFTKRAPSRMTLSKRVGQSNPKSRATRNSNPPTRSSWAAEPVRTKRPSFVDDDPFGKSDRPKSKPPTSFKSFDSKFTSGENSNTRRDAPSPSRGPRKDFAERKPFQRDDSFRGPRKDFSERKPFQRDDSFRGPRKDFAERKPFQRDESSRRPRKDFAERKPFQRDEFSRGPRKDFAERKPFQRDEFSRGPRKDFAERKSFQRDDSFRGPRKPFQRDDSSRGPRKPFQRDDSFRGPRKDFGEKRSFRRDDDSPGHLNRTEAPRDLVPPQRKERNRGGFERSKSAPHVDVGHSKFGAGSRHDRRQDPSSNGDMKRKSKGKEHFHALKMQQTLEPISYNRRTSIKGRISELDDFLYFDLLPEVQESIPSQGLPGVASVQPTPAQRVAIPALLGMDREKSSNMEQFLLAAETGSGKTLAYMVPIIDAMKRAELKEKQEEVAKEQEKQDKEDSKMFELEPPPLSGQENPNAGRPRVIILVPSAELVQQVGALAKSFSHTVKFRAALISAVFSPTRIRNTLFSPQGVDMVISTPHLLASIGESDPNIFSRVTHLVVDEADSLLDRSFSPLTTNIIDKSTPSLKQLIFCSATIPNSMDGYLRKHFPDTIRLVTPNIHAIPRRVQMAVVNVSQDPYRGNKDLACAETLHQIAKSQVEHWDEEREVAPTKRIIVFVNEREKSVEVAEYLKKKGFDAVALNRDAGMERQAQVLAEFGSSLYIDKREIKKKSDEEKAASPVATPSKFPNTKILVATDLGSRGIDTTAVRHVVLYDVPHTTIDFIHRIGRTGRMGRRGRAIVLLGKGDRADVVKEVRETMFKGQALI